MTLADFDFALPAELIAQQPPVERGQSRLLVVDRSSGALADRHFTGLPDLLRPDDLLVVNDTQVFAARLIGRRLPGGGAAECLLLQRVERHSAASDEQQCASAVPWPDPGAGEIWEALVHPGQRLKTGSSLQFGESPRRIHAVIVAQRFHGRRLVRLWAERGALADAVDEIGHVPLPPYIRRSDLDDDRVRYQTVYARERGSIAAPTAGLHFTPRLLAALDARGVERVAITLHVGYGTFQPIRSERIEQHTMPAERYSVTPTVAAALTRAVRERRRIIAVGTTTTRTLESLSVSANGVITPETASTDLFLTPGACFRVVSGLVTNFHLPKSSLLLLVSAFGGSDLVMRAYRHAVAERYRFYSYGDAMFIA